MLQFSTQVCCCPRALQAGSNTFGGTAFWVGTSSRGSLPDSRSVARAECASLHDFLKLKAVQTRRGSTWDAFFVAEFEGSRHRTQNFQVAKHVRLLFTRYYGIADANACRGSGSKTQSSPTDHPIPVPPLFTYDEAACLACAPDMPRL